MRRAGLPCDLHGFAVDRPAFTLVSYEKSLKVRQGLPELARKIAVRKKLDNPEPTKTSHSASNSSSVNCRCSNAASIVICEAFLFSIAIQSMLSFT